MANRWIKWEGGKCPVKRGTRVDVKYRNRKTRMSMPAGVMMDGLDASDGMWKHDGFGIDIVAYRLSEAPKRPRTKSGKPKVETPKRKRVWKPVPDLSEEQIKCALMDIKPSKLIVFPEGDEAIEARCLALAKETAESANRTTKALRDNLPADPYEAYKVDYQVTIKDGPMPYQKAQAFGTLHEDSHQPDKSLADSVILVGLGIVSGAIATAACFLIFA